MLSGMRYRHTGSRDLRLDFLRGYALLVMTINHAGLESSIYRPFTGGSVFLISAAEVFLFISGFTLGMISFGRPVGRALERVLSRTWVLYLTTIGVGLAFTVLALTTPFSLWGGPGDLRGPEVLIHLIGTLTLREVSPGVDILVLYVIYLACAPLVLWALARGRTWAVVGGLTAIYLFAQVDPALTTVIPVSFRDPAANAPLFIGAMVLGYHRDALARRFAAFRGRHIVDGLVIFAALALGVLYATGFAMWPALGAALGENIRVTRELTMPPLPLAIVLVYVRALWLAVTHLWTPLSRWLGWLVMPLGRASLFTFCIHLLVMPFLFSVPGFSQEYGVVGATIWATVDVALVLGAVLARNRILSLLVDQTERHRTLAARVPLATVAILIVGCVTISIADRPGSEDRVEERQDDSPVRTAIVEADEPG